MEHCVKFYFSLLIVYTCISCDNLTNETYYHLNINERRKLSADYTQLALRFDRGSPDNMLLLEKAIRLNPQNDLAYYEMALPYLYNGLYKEWNYYMSKAIHYNPQAWQAMRGYQKIFCLRDYGGALYDLDATDTLTQDRTDYAYNLSVDYLRGICYLGLDNLDKAEEYFKIYIERESADVGMEYIDESAFLYLGIISNKRTEYREALGWFEKHVLYERGQADVYYHKANSQWHLNNLEEAEKNIVMAEQLFLEDQYLRGFICERPWQLYLKYILDLKSRILYDRS